MIFSFPEETEKNPNGDFRLP